MLKTFGNAIITQCCGRNIHSCNYFNGNLLNKKQKLEIFKDHVRYHRDRTKDRKTQLDKTDRWNIYKELHPKSEKIALLLGYCGHNYFGMQRADYGGEGNILTIEGELLKAMNKSGVLHPDEFYHPSYMSFQRTSRTDKSVSALKQVVSFNVGVPVLSNFVETINFHLPPEIRIYGYKKVSRNFNCKVACDSRTYSYVLPTFALTPIDQLTKESNRITNRTWELTNDLLQEYKGTHNFYNFTCKRLPYETSSIRTILDIKCSEPFVKDDLELITITIKGESFMLHQIRKMIGLAIAIARELVPVDLIEKSWELQRVHIPRAPGIGLFLHEPHFDWYNDNFTGEGNLEPLVWDQYQNEIEALNQEHILPSIVQMEKNERSMMKWLVNLTHHTWDIDDNNTSFLGFMEGFFKPSFKQPEAFEQCLRREFTN